MSGQTKSAWDEVEKHFTELGQRLGEHYRRLGTEEKAASAEERQKLDEAVHSLTDQLDRAFTSLGNTLRDPDTKDTATKAARSLGDALAATFADVSEQIRRTLGSKKPEPPASS